MVLVAVTVTKFTRFLKLPAFYVGTRSDGDGTKRFKENPGTGKQVLRLSAHKAAWKDGAGFSLFLPLALFEVANSVRMRTPSRLYYYKTDELSGIAPIAH